MCRPSFTSRRIYCWRCFCPTWTQRREKKPFAAGEVCCAALLELTTLRRGRELRFLIPAFTYAPRFLEVESVKGASTKCGARPDGWLRAAAQREGTS